MNGRLIAGGLVGFALVFGAALWWFQTRGHYVSVEGVEEVVVAGEHVPVAHYEGIDGGSSPLKLRACFRADGLDGPEAEAAEPLVAPGWFACFDAERISQDLAAGRARAILAESNAPYGFDRVVAAYPDGRAYEWRQINRCGHAFFEGEPVPDGCPAPNG